MTFAQWFALIDAIRRDHTLCQLTLDAYTEDERGAGLACFSDPTRCAYVILAGTGPGEWPDNCQGVYLTDTEQQIRALEWFTNQVASRQYRQVVASGHSKGGNKAMYLAIRAGAYVDAAVSFDGQGFSQQFQAAYADEIAQHADKITAYALDNDIVNGLLNPIAAPENRIYLTGQQHGSPYVNHAPFALLTPRSADPYRFALRRPGTQGSVGAVSVRFTDYLQTEVDPQELPGLCQLFATSLEGRLRTDLTPDQRRTILRTLVSSAYLERMVEVFYDFFHRIGVDASSREVLLMLLGFNPKDNLDFDALGALARTHIPEALHRLMKRAQ